MTRNAKVREATVHHRGARASRPRRVGRRGQAMVELVAAIIGILVVVTGLLQLILLGTADTNTLVAAGARAAVLAGASVAMAESPDLVADWRPGRDGLMQTKDDVAVRGTLANTQRHIAAVVAPHGDWAAVHAARHNALAALHHGPLPSGTLGFVSGRAAETVEVLPAAQALFGLRNPVEVRNEVWMTATGGLY